MTPKPQYEKIDANIIKVLQKAKEPMTPYQIAIAANMAYSTAVTHLKDLMLNKVVERKKENGNKPRTLYWLKGAKNKKM